jgi:hypothetical protein
MMDMQGIDNAHDPVPFWINKAEKAAILASSTLALVAAFATSPTMDVGVAGSYQWIELRNFIYDSTRSGVWRWVALLRQGVADHIVEALESGETCFQSYFPKSNWRHDELAPVETSTIVTQFKTACENLRS